MNEDDIQLILKQYNSKFITYKNLPGFYKLTDVAEVVSRGFKINFEIGKVRPNHIDDRPDSFIIKSDNNSLLNELIVRDYIRALRFDEKTFFLLLC